MNTVRIVHCADLHLGSPFAGLGRKALARRADLQQTFRRVLEICREQQAEVLLIAGDLFDNGHPSRELVETVRDGFAALPDVAIAIAPGNHDPMTVDSPYALEGFWPENVHIFAGAMQPLALEKQGICLWGAGFTGAFCEQPLCRFPERMDEHLIHIGVMHGTLISGENTPYNPVTSAEIAASGLDYLALGHIHAFSGIQRAGRTYYAYPGCPEGRGFDELGEKGVLVGEIGRDCCTLSLIPTARRKYIALDVCVDGLARNAVEPQVRAAIAAAGGQDYAEQLYKVRLHGTLPENATVDLAQLAAAFADIFHVKFRDQTQLEVDLAAEAGDFSLRGIFLRRMAERLHPGEDETAMLALQLGLRALTGEVNYYVD